MVGRSGAGFEPRALLGKRSAGEHSSCIARALSADFPSEVLQTKLRVLWMIDRPSATQLHCSPLFSTGSSVCLVEEGYPGWMQCSDIFIRTVLKYV